MGDVTGYETAGALGATVAKDLPIDSCDGAFPQLGVPLGMLLASGATTLMTGVLLAVTFASAMWFVFTASGPT